MKTINAGVERDGAFYLFTMRLVPAFPFFVINLVMGLTPMRTLTFAFVSQLGMLPGTIVYVNAGTQLGRIESLQGILSPMLIGSFVLLGVFPLVAKWIVGVVQGRRQGPAPRRGVIARDRSRYNPSTGEIKLGQSLVSSWKSSDCSTSGERVREAVDTTPRRPLRDGRERRWR